MAAQSTVWDASRKGSTILCPAPHEGTRGAAELERGSCPGSREGAGRRAGAGRARAGLAESVGWHAGSLWPSLGHKKEQWVM